MQRRWRAVSEIYPLITVVHYRATASNQHQYSAISACLLSWHHREQWTYNVCSPKKLSCYKKIQRLLSGYLPVGSSQSLYRFSNCLSRSGVCAPIGRDKSRNVDALYKFSSCVPIHTHMTACTIHTQACNSYRTRTHTHTHTHTHTPYGETNMHSERKSYVHILIIST